MSEYKIPKLQQPVLIYIFKKRDFEIVDYLCSRTKTQLSQRLTESGISKTPNNKIVMYR